LIVSWLLLRFSDGLVYSLIRCVAGWFIGRLEV
jgi:hypothetical protein